jgi:hypothetical protein
MMWKLNWTTREVSKLLGKGCVFSHTCVVLSLGALHKERSVRSDSQPPSEGEEIRDLRKKISELDTDNRLLNENVIDFFEGCHAI